MSIPIKYRLSGALGSSVIVLPLVSIVCGTLSGMLYGYLVVALIGWGKITFLLEAGIVVGTAIIVGVAGRRSKCRNSLFMLAMALLCAVAMLYAIWATFAHVVPISGKPAVMNSLMDWFSSPSMLWDWLSELSETGWYSTRSSSSSTARAVNGIELLAGWYLEAALILIVVTWAGYGFWSGAAFCESCGDWCKETKGTAVRDATGLLSNSSELESKLKAGHLEELVLLPRVTGAKDGDIHIVVDHQLCKHCGNTGTYLLRKLVFKEEKKGLTTNDSKWTPMYVLDVDSIVALGKLTAPSPSTPPPGKEPPE